MKYLFLLWVVLLTGCSLSLSFEEVKRMETACKSGGGEVNRVMRGNVVVSIHCLIDGAEYWVAPSGKLK